MGGEEVVVEVEVEEVDSLVSRPFFQLFFLLLPVVPVVPFVVHGVWMRTHCGVYVCGCAWVCVCVRGCAWGCVWVCVGVCRAPGETVFRAAVVWRRSGGGGRRRHGRRDCVADWEEEREGEQSVGRIAVAGKGRGDGGALCAGRIEGGRGGGRGGREWRGRDGLCLARQRPGLVLLCPQRRLYPSSRQLICSVSVCLNKYLCAEGGRLRVDPVRLGESEAEVVDAGSGGQRVWG